MSRRSLGTAQARALPLSKRQLLFGALATAVTLATPQSRLLAASNKHPVKLALSNGTSLEIDQEKVFLVEGAARRPVRQGVFSLTSGGRVEVRGGKVFSAAVGPGDAFVENNWTDWIEFGGGSGGGQPKTGAASWLQKNGKRRLGR